MHISPTWRRAAAAVAVLAGSATGSYAADQMTIAFTTHAAATGVFWQSVKKGFDDACATIQASCQIVFTQNDGSIEQQVANMQAVIARKPDVLITSLVDNKAFVNVLTDAAKQGILVIASNVDATDGPEMGLRAAFIGQNFVPAGRILALRLADHFPKDGPIRVLIGDSAPGQNWSEQRAEGVMNGLEEWKKANPSRQVVIDKIDSSTEIAVTADRVNAYLSAHPDTTAYFEMTSNHAGVAFALKDRGVAPGKILMGGFDLVPQVLEMMKAGYVQVEIDQQPYEQGYMPVMEGYLWKKAGIAAADINTGSAVVTPDMVDQILQLSKAGYR